jgi:hypothetical protein
MILAFRNNILVDDGTANFFAATHPRVAVGAVEDSEGDVASESKLVSSC